MEKSLLLRLSGTEMLAACEPAYVTLADVEKKERENAELLMHNVRMSGSLLYEISPWQLIMRLHKHECVVTLVFPIEPDS